MFDKGKLGDIFGGNASRGAIFGGGGLLRGVWSVVARAPDGRAKWTDTLGHINPDTGLWVPHNIIVNAGLDYILDAGLSGGTPITTWYAGLTDGTPTVAAGDTSASHAGWVEVTAYDEANRVTWVDGGVSSQSCDNSGNTATFTISSDATTVGGAFLISQNTKGGSTGTLYAAGAFSAGDKILDDNDTLDVTATFTMADDA